MTRCHLCNTTANLTTVTAWDRVTRSVCRPCRDRALTLWRHVPAVLTNRAAMRRKDVA